MNALAIAVGVDMKTIQSWIGILESSYVIYMLRSHHKNFNKVLVKRPKVYFTDPSLVCHLLEIRSQTQLQTHSQRGAIFEGMIVIELLKQRFNSGQTSNIYFWRDKTGREIDVIMDNGEQLIPLEIKSGMTITSDYFKNIKYWTNLSKQDRALILYQGKQEQKRSDGSHVLNWRNYFLAIN